MGGHEDEQAMICAHGEFTRSAPFFIVVPGSPGKAGAARVLTYLSIPPEWVKPAGCHPPLGIMLKSKVCVFSLHDVKNWLRYSSFSPKSLDLSTF